MRCWILSDLHIDVGSPWEPPAIPDADVALVAGDVGEGLVDSISWLAAVVRPRMRVVFVAGNHEYYRTTLTEELARGRAAAAMQGVDLLENDTVEIDGVSISGCTLWTDYRLDGDALMRASMEDARRAMNDHRRIAWATKPDWKRFRPEEAAALHRTSRAYLESEMASGNTKAGQSRIVVTHHAPSARSVEPKYAGKSLNPCYASHLDQLVADAHPALWVHGHTHGSAHYAIGSTQVVCNPKGYGNENVAFDPALLMDVP